MLLEQINSQCRMHSHSGTNIQLAATLKGPVWFRLYGLCTEKRQSYNATKITSVGGPQKQTGPNDKYGWTYHTRFNS
jgi:hypothetical protein